MSEIKSVLKGFDPKKMSQIDGRLRKQVPPQRPLPRLVSEPYRDYAEYFEGSLAVDIDEESTQCMFDLNKTDCSGTSIESVSPRLRARSSGVIPIDRYYKTDKGLASSLAKGHCLKFAHLILDISKFMTDGLGKLLNNAGDLAKTKVARAVFLVLFMFILVFGPSVVFHSFSHASHGQSVISASPVVITVQEGQTVQSLAYKLNPVSPQKVIAQINAQTDSSTLYVGEKIIVRK